MKLHPVRLKGTEKKELSGEQRSGPHLGESKQVCNVGEPVVKEGGKRWRRAEQRYVSDAAIQLSKGDKSPSSGLLSKHRKEK